MSDDARRRAEAFVREVEAAMVDLSPHRRAELTADLADHLLEPGDDGTLLIDTEDLDARSYAEELRLAAPPADEPGALAPQTDSAPRRRLAPLLAGAALLTLIVAGGTWVAATVPWSRDAEPTATATPSPEPDLVYVPDVWGLSRADAIAVLEDLGLSVTVVVLPDGDSIHWSESLPPDSAAATEPFYGEAVPAGMEVVLLVTP